MIPVYQRNYAWEEDEISALVKDVYDSYKKNSKAPYYIGTLVTFKRGDNVYEVIDGQQRLTTIYIILKVLKEKEIRNKLTYGARKISATTIENLGSYPNLGDEFDSGIRNGYKFAEKAISTIVSKVDFDDFKQYFLHYVHIIRYKVPKDVDLNHYFEVMNSRGEQLEKHEIVKSILCQELKEEIPTFCRVWEACSEMNIYIQQAFKEEKVFGENYDNFTINSFSDIPKSEISENSENSENSYKKVKISKLLDELINDDKSSIEQNDKFQPIIDFPNFLLIVLKVTLIMNIKDFNPTDFTLDDKELLNEFGKALSHFSGKNASSKLSGKADFARLFLFNLLKARYFLDNYIIHHSNNDKELSGDNPWKLQYYHVEKNDNKKKIEYPKNYVDSDIQDELVHLLSMFEVTFTAKQRKNYLFYCMMFLFEKPELKAEEYLSFLQDLANKYFFDVYLNSACLNERNQPVPNAFDSIILLGKGLNRNLKSSDMPLYRNEFINIYKQGSADIPLFVFNFTDYKLWKKYAVELRGKKYKKGSEQRENFFKNILGCSDFDLDSFNNFYFSRTRKSLEHYYPQAKAGEEKPLSSDVINCFGNFAMIGSEANSSGGDLDPINKLAKYLDSKSDPISVASLKFKIMMQKCQDNAYSMQNATLTRNKYMEWNNEDMLEHQGKMLDIIFL